MKLTALRLARENLRNHKRRARLSTIGVVISVFLVSLIFIISDSVKASIQQQVDTLANSTVIINGASSNNLLNLTTDTPSSTLSNTDSQQIDRIVSSGAITHENLFISGNLTFDNTQISNTITVATNYNSAESLGVSMVDGAWFDEGGTKKMVVLGEDLANRLLGGNEVQNQVVDIKGQKYTVVGIIRKVNQPLSIMGYDIDNCAFISLVNGQKLMENENLSQIVVSDVSDIAETKQQVATILSSNHSDSSDYSVDTGENIASKLNQLVNYLTIGACVLSSIVLLVSCISIANIMLVNVVERRREIGIRKAVGATTRNIMSQFVTESLIMSLRGGVIGLILAYIVAAVALLFFQMRVVFSWWALGVGFVIPIAIGIIAGIYPAWKASRQDIIDALNQLT